MFFSHTSNFIIQVLIKNQIIEKQDKDLYLYGMKSFSHILVNFLTALLIGIFTNRLTEVILFFIFFIPLRSYAGGYHTKNKLTCYCFSNLLLVFIIYLPSSILKKFDFTAFIYLFILSILIVFLLAPLPNYNRTFDKIEKKIFRKRTQIILLLEIFTIILLYFTYLKYWLILSMLAPISVAFLLMLNIISNAVSLIRGNNK